MTANPWARPAGLFVVVFVGSLAGALLSLEAFGASELGPVFFPPAGVAVAALLASPRTRWPAVLAAVMLAEGVIDLMWGYEAYVVVIHVLTHALGSLVGASLVLAWCRGVPDLRRRRDLALFVAGGCVAGPLAGGIIGGVAIARHFGAWWPGAVLHWFASDAIGVLVVAAPILLWPRRSGILRERRAEAVGILGITAAVSWLAVWAGVYPSMMLLPVLAWAALRLDVFGAALAGAVATVAVNLRAASGLSLFSGMSLSAEGRLAIIQFLIAVNVLLAMLIAQEACAHRDAVSERAREQRERQRLETMAGLAQQLLAAVTPRDIRRVVQQQLVADVGADRVHLGLVSPGRSRPDWVAGDDTDPVATGEPGLAAEVIRSSRPVLGSPGTGTSGNHPIGVAGWPLTAGTGTTGALLIEWSTPQSLDDVQQAHISAVATITGQAVVRAKSFADEHDRAVMLHHAAHPVAPVRAEGLSYRALYLPTDVAYGLGGDWYSVMPLPQERTYLSVGDVIGHGLVAVEDMTQLRGTGNAYAYQGSGPAGVLARLNDFAGSQIRGEFATNLVVIYDPRTCSLSYSSAGHPPALLRRADTGEVIRLAGAPGPVLGPFDDATYTEATVEVNPGDVLVMYSDGLVEHHDLNVEAGIDHFEQVIANWPPEGLLDCEALAQDVAPRPLADDICLLVARFVAGDDRAPTPGGP